MNQTDRLIGNPAADGRRKLLYESGRTRVFRARPAGVPGSVIYKEPHGYGAARRLRHEQALLERLAHIAGVVRVAPVAPPPGMIALEDMGADTLADAVARGPLPVNRLLDLACELATILEGVHEARVIHRDLNPTNILWSGAAPRLSLIDFDLATVAAEELPAFTHPSTITGTLAYLAPEQTGRTGWSVDQRADLYGFGAVLYELATGQPPFGFGDPLQLLHDHLARVPAAPIERNPALPRALSQVILRLLEKEPDLRYQSASGLAHDLGAIRRAPRELLLLGERDFPSRLPAPSRLAGREPELHKLAEAVRQVAHGQTRGMMITGAPGVGKSFLLDQTRSIVTEQGGWFVSGKFDQFRQDLETNGAQQAICALCRLMLAEPEEELARLRLRLLENLGPNAGLTSSFLTDLAPLLGFPPAPPPADPVTVKSRMLQGGLAVLGTIASPGRPVVLALDDLQWAASLPLEFVDAILTGDEYPGVLVVGTYRDAEVGADHPLTALLARWDRLGRAPERLRLSNLPRSAIATMLCELLRLGEDEALALAAALTARTDGNPYDTIELINALRRDNALTPTATGWQWDPERIANLSWRGGVSAVLSARIAALPARTVSLLEIMACLGGTIDSALLAEASGFSTRDVERDLVPALEEGVIVAADGITELRFRHDRMQQAAYDRLTPERLAGQRLAIGRRLALLPHRQILAAEQLLTVPDSARSPEERHHLIALFRTAAEDARRVFNTARAERFLTAAASLLPPETPATQTAVELAIERHACLYGVGKRTEADVVYQQLTELTTDPLVLASAAGTQISSLAARNRACDAVSLGLELMAALGEPVPEGEDQLPAAIEQSLSTVYEWVATSDELDDLRRPDCEDQRILAVARIIDRLLPPAFMFGYPGTPLLVLAAARMWATYGPARELVGPLSYLALFTIGLRDDYRTGATIVRRVLAVSESRGYEPETSHVRCDYAVSCAPWFEPLDDVVEIAHRAHEGLVKGGEQTFATHAYYCSLPILLSCSRGVADLVAEADSALAFAARTSNDDAAGLYGFFRQLASTLRGEAGGFRDPAFNVDQRLATLGGNRSMVAVAHGLLGISAAIFGDTEELVRHATAVESLLPFVLGTYHSTFNHLVLALGLAERVRTSRQERDQLLGRFDSQLAWFASRAADSPGTFGHLVPWLEAERAWAIADFEAAMVGFDAAVRAATQRQRRWQQGLIAERAAKFCLAHGLQLTANAMLRDARFGYEQWGAAAKVRELDQQYPVLGSPLLGSAPSQLPEEAGRHTSAISVEEIDLLGVLDASQALSSETNLDRLRIRVKSVLKAMTGATEVQVVLWNEDSSSWYLSVDQDMVSLEEAAKLGLVPLSACRYVERTAEPLVVADATRDGRFAKDPYFSGMKRCSLLAVPILSRGAARALIVLENQLSRNAFVGDRLDSVMLIAGQLAVSVDNALLYASLERKVAERTEALAIANQRLEALSVTDALTGLANRRRLSDVLDLEWQRALRPGSPLAIAMIDIDHFKAYNDYYGHPAGDQCLRRVAAVLNETVRVTDLVARYGGEEFAVVMPSVNLVVAKRIAERIREAVAGLKHPHERSPMGVVTVSVGVAATVPSCAGLPEQLIDLADHRLYEAKNHGRNRVVFA